MKIGICDWTLKMVQDKNVFEKAKALGFNGVQVAFDIKDNGSSLINKKVQESYQEYSSRYGLSICSCAAVNYMRMPISISKEPVSVFSDYIEAMKNLGINKILLPFFGTGDLNSRTSFPSLVLRSIRRVPPKDEMLDKTIEILKNIAVIVGGAQITVGLETKMNAEALLELLRKIGSENVKVYYDAGNANAMGYNIFDEVKLLGMENICQIHIKERFTTIGGGKIDYKRFIESVIGQGYKDWLIIEDSINLFLGKNKSMKKNALYLKEALMEYGQES